jgi:AraC-like DNA-binding protein
LTFGDARQPDGMPRRLSETESESAKRADWFSRTSAGRWCVSLPVVDPTPGFPVTDCVAREAPATPAYRMVNRDRRGERFCLLKITVAGEGRFRDARGEHRLPAGRAFLCRVDDPATSYYYPPGGRAPWEMVWLQFSGEASFALTDALVARHGAVFELGVGNPLIRRLLAFGALRRTVALQTQTEALLLVASALEALDAAARTGSAGDDGLVERAVALIERRLGEGVGVAEVADAIGVSREHLSRQFVARLGCSAQRYLRRERVRQACLLLRADDLPLKTIARRCGLGSPEVLIRSFAAELGITPGRYRRTAGGRS